MPERHQAPAVLVAVPTRGRRNLQPALGELARQAASCDAEVEIVVLDNSGLNLIDGASLAATYGCRVESVATPGLALVRNAAINLLQARHDALLFLDDDERPEPKWLDAMISAHRSHAATVVLGPVRTEVPPDAPGWLLGGAFWRAHVERPDGGYEGEAYSGNTLIDADFLRRSGLRFDGCYDTTGGEDTDFFRRLRAAGGNVVWAQDAAVVELVDAQRATVRGAVLRAFHAANLSWRLDRVEWSANVRSRMFLRRTGRLPRGAARLAAGVAAWRADRIVLGLCDCAAAAGTLMSALGHRTEYYR